VKKIFIQCLLMVMVLVATCGAQVQRKAVPHSKIPGSCVRVQDGAFHSAAIDREMKYRVLLPCFYQSSSGRFPVLYLLHGLHGDYLNWDTRTSLERYALRYALIVVMPDARDSCYTNSATDPKRASNKTAIFSALDTITRYLLRSRRNLQCQLHSYLISCGSSWSPSSPLRGQDLKEADRVWQTGRVLRHHIRVA
jgi:Putative esterase